MALNFKVIIEDYVRTGTLSVTPAIVPTLGINNLKTVLRGEVAQTLSTAPHTIKINFQQPSLVDSFALSRHNISSVNATLRLKLYSGLNQTGDLVYDSGQFKTVKPLGWGEFIWGIDAWGGSVFKGEDVKKAFTQLYFPPAFAYSAELIIEDSNPLFAFFSMCRLYLGRSLAVNSKALMPLDLTENQNKSVLRMESGISYPVVTGQGYRNFEINLNHIPQSEAFQLYEAVRKAIAQDVWVSLFPEDSSSTKEQLFSFSARIESLPKVSASGNSYFYNTNLSIVET